MGRAGIGPATSLRNRIAPLASFHLRTYEPGDAPIWTIGNVRITRVVEMEGALR